jgi:hypothetical protein
MSSSDQPGGKPVTPDIGEVLESARARAREASAEASAAVQTPFCEAIHDAVDQFMERRCRQKHNELKPCEGTHTEGCPCDGCREARIPELRPCISIRWGDSDCDCMETNDTEVLCITVCNCFSNVTFKDLSIAVVWVAGADLLPDGTPSVDIRPLGPLCFGDLPPCRDNRPSCVSREVVLMTRGARPGGYQIRLAGICFSAVFAYEADACFQLDLCRD